MSAAPEALPTKAAEPVLTVAGVHKAFGSAIVLDGIGFALRAGETTGLIGPNGAGKTTLFNLIAGVETPDRGDIRVRGDSIVGVSPAARARRGVSRTFQEIRLFEGLTALENVMIGCQDNAGEAMPVAVFRWLHCRASDRRAQRQAEDLLRMVGLAGLEDRLPGELSYGQQKRVGIARALATGRDLLCLDEPAAGLDPEAARELVALLARLRGEAGTILLIEHNLELVRELCERAIMLDGGRIVVDDTPATVLADERVWRAFMGV